MDLSHKGFERKPDRSTSLFNASHLLNARHAAVFEQVLIDRLELLLKKPERSLAMEGTLLSSAVLFGALINRRLWPSWFAASRGDVISTEGRGRAIWQQSSFRADSSNSIEGTEGDLAASRQCFEAISPHSWIPSIPSTGRIWIELNAEREEPLRWVADPFTEALLIYWQKVRFNAIDEFDVVDAVAAAFGASSWEHRNKLKLVIRLHLAARAKWQMRMPGCLIEAIDRRRRSVILPAPRWVGLFEPERCQDQARFDPKPVAPKRRHKGKIATLIQKLLPKGQNHSSREFAVAASELAKKFCCNDIDPVKRLVLLWAASRLAPELDLRQRKRRFAPSTIALRSERLLAFLEFTFKDQEPNLLSTEKFADKINDALSRSDCTNITRADLACFTDWNSRNVQDQSVMVSYDVRSRGGVRAGMISMADYRAIICRFTNRTRKSAICRLTTMLGFRAGLRWHEVEALAVGDLLVEDGIIELTVRPNSERRTKTLGSRRVLPLHVLMDEEECAELISWWRSRRAERSPHTLSHRDPSEHWRLFPHYEILLLEQVKKDIEAAIRGVTSGTESIYHVLRHSFASAMIATFLLPEDYRDCEPCPQIDPELVSVARRDRLAAALLGDGVRSRDGLRAVASLLGHSSEKTTIRSYFHLHDWLVGVYVARPRVQPRLPTSLISTITGKNSDVIRRENRRARLNNPDMFDLDVQHTQRGQKEDDDSVTGADIIWPLFSASRSQLAVQSHGSLKTVSAEKSRVAGFKSIDPEILTWQALNALFCSVGECAQEDARQHPELISSFGDNVANALLKMLAERTRGRSGTSNYRFLEVPHEARKQRVRLLSLQDRSDLEKFYTGFSHLTWSDLSKLCEIFRIGYDRARGVIRMHLLEETAITSILVKSGCTLDNIHSQTSTRSATIWVGSETQVGSEKRMNRGFVRALIFASAIQAAHAADQRKIKDFKDQSVKANALIA